MNDCLPRMNESRTLVEHFFRHEYGRLVAVLTRSLGVRNLELAEDVVQSSISRALQTWGRSGIPGNPSAWLYRTSRNLAIDAIRRTNTESRLIASGAFEVHPSSGVQNLFSAFADEVGDESLRLLFLCCHPSIPLESSIAFALRTVSGFSTDEVTSALLISKSNVEKRIARTKEKLREIGTEIIELDEADIGSRIDAVQSTIYLLFNEGYASSSGHSILRKELCEEAIRLARMLIRTVRVSVPSSTALLSLMLMHSARFDARIDAYGAMVMLEDQDRSRWDWNRIREGMHWMAISADGDHLSRFHVEAAIAWEHCRPHSFDEVDWSKITNQYQILERIQPSPMVRLNLAIAMSFSSGAEIGLVQLAHIPSEDRARLRPWWDCAMADVYSRLGKCSDAISHWQDALLLASNEDQRTLITKRIERTMSKLENPAVTRAAD